jgi:hypothetical protein
MPILVSASHKTSHKKDIQDGNGRTPLHIAALYANKDLFLELAPRTSLFYTDNEGNNIFHLLCTAAQTKNKLNQEEDRISILEWLWNQIPLAQAQEMIHSMSAQNVRPHHLAAAQVSPLFCLSHSISRG